MKNKENNPPLLNGRTKALIGLVVAEGLLLSLFKFILKLAFVAGFAFLVYGFFLLIQGGPASKIFLLAGAGLTTFSFFMLMLFRFFETKSSRNKNEDA